MNHYWNKIFSFQPEAIMQLIWSSISCKSGMILLVMLLVYVIWLSQIGSGIRLGSCLPYVHPAQGTHPRPAGMLGVLH